MNELKILCPFCSRPYTAEMLVELDHTYYSEVTGCDYSAMVEIRCSHCKRIVYTKKE